MASIKLNEATLLQFANIVNTCKSHFEVERVTVQQQRGTADCGMFAVAFAISLCTGSDPVTLTFEQMKMRDHLLQCFEKRKITPFPLSQRKIVSRSLCTRSLEKVNVYCVCRLPDFYGNMMIECELCHQWYHYECVDVKSVKNWKCEECFFLILFASFKWLLSVLCITRMITHLYSFL